MEELSPLRAFPVKNGRAWLVIGSLALNVLVFIVGWWGGQQSRWMAMGDSRRRLEELEEWKRGVDVFRNDISVQCASMDATNGLQGQSIRNLEETTREMRQRVDSLMITTARCCGGR